MASGNDYDAQLARGHRGRRVGARRVLGPRHDRHRHTPPTSCARTTTSGTATTASCRSRSRPTSRTTPTGTIAQAKELWARLDRPNVMIKIPATAEGIPAIAATLDAGLNVNVTLIFSLGALRRGRRRVPRGARAPRRPRRRHLADRVGRVVLREPGRHRDRPPAPRGSPAARQGRGRQRQARVPALPRSVRRRRAGTRSPRRARGCSARCGRRRPRRTRRTPPRSTSTR